MRVYFVRHGETEENATDRTQFSESPLSKKGKTQAKALAQRFKSISFDKIISSDYERAGETARIISKENGSKEIIYSELFRERRLPKEARGQSKKDEQVKKVLALFETRNGDPAWRYSDDESWNELKERAISGVEFLEKTNLESILVVTHGGILRTILGVLLFGQKLTLKEGLALDGFVSTTNTGITIAEYTKRGVQPFTNLPREWRLITWNDQAHLGE